MHPMLIPSYPVLRRICVFCGASHGRHPVYGEVASRLGETLAHQDIELVYGGGNVGLMGVIADACLRSGGKVTGIIPKSLVGREIDGERVEHRGVTHLEVVDSMHTRKARMAELADGFMALPGGFGTLEELFEILTWAQLGFHQKPIGLLNTQGYFDPLLGLLDHALEEQFIRPENLSLLLHEQEPDALLLKMKAYQPPPHRTWIDNPEQL